MKKLIAALVVTASAALSIGAGGVGIALGDPNPTLGERIFISLEGGGLSNHKTDTITLTCTRGSALLLQSSSLAMDYGAWFQLGPTDTWTSGSAMCTAQLTKPDKRGPKVEDSFNFNVTG